MLLSYLGEMKVQFVCFISLHLFTDEVESRQIRVRVETPDCISHNTPSARRPIRPRTWRHTTPQRVACSGRSGSSLHRSTLRGIAPSTHRGDGIAHTGGTSIPSSVSTRATQTRLCPSQWLPMAFKKHVIVVRRIPRFQHPAISNLERKEGGVALA